ncbi:MAG: L,D-transpeptidase family protein [Bacteriovoracaceae bacterium]|nr:L,D-transpeptidase family protein [Bacteriovoracaceae bacterium]
MVVVFFIVLTLVGYSQAEAKQIDTLLPQNLLRLDRDFSPHAIIVEKSTRKLHIFKAQDQIPKRIRSFNVAIGEIIGRKEKRGDKKTPEGIYWVQKYLTAKNIFTMYGQEAKIYGNGAFVLNYPNLIDKSYGRKGSGIWIHGTDDVNKISKGRSSKGCVVLTNTDLVRISNFIQLRATPIILVRKINYLTVKKWKQLKSDITGLVRKWKSDWENENFNNYIDFYHENYFDPFRKNLKQFENYKKAVFNNPGKPHVKLTNTVFLHHQEYMIIRFAQAYHSKTVRSYGVKKLYVKRNEENKWKIISEQWNRI